MGGSDEPDRLDSGRDGTIGGLGAVRSGGRDVFEGPASNPDSCKTGKPVKGLIQGSLPITYALGGFGELRVGGLLEAAVGA